MKFLLLFVILSGSIVDASARTIPRGVDKNGNPLPCPRGYEPGANNSYCKEMNLRDWGGKVMPGGGNQVKEKVNLNGRIE
ncbi:MAG: hypothetical protein H0V66_02020 [Bdellovibrionales bacterium]|nr:hypothetical protein [Bdellovibrionales bacterium]